MNLDILKNAPEDRKSYYELQYLIIETEPTHQGKLWKCLKELQKRADLIERLTYKVSYTNSKNPKKNQIKRKIKFIEQEMKFLTNFYNALSKIEEIKDFDDFHSQQSYWDTKFAQELNQKILFRIPLDIKLIHNIMALPENSMAKQSLLGIIDRLLNKNGHNT